MELGARDGWRLLRLRYHQSTFYRMRGNLLDSISLVAVVTGWLVRSVQRALSSHLNESVESFIGDYSPDVVAFALLGGQDIPD